MDIILNGESYRVKAASTLTELLNELNIHPQRVAVEVNLQIIKKANYEHHSLNDGDSVEIVNFVGGG
ncbi:ThiS, thiamine-biosynthesis [Candidatus Magnetoovum chiemensis]|nr:ThiS, thiamine-biosynthesis [Candidatus Magnetoovum chiemensis]